MKIVYVAHRLGVGSDRESNRTNAQAWVAWLAYHFEIAPIADWTILAGHWPETLRERGLEIDLALISRCDEVWMVGDLVSPGMRIEAAEAIRLGKPVRDLTGFSMHECSQIESRERLIEMCKRLEAYWTNVGS